MFKVVLVATDGSAHGTRATETAASIAGRYGARLLVLSVVPPGPPPRSLTDISHEERSSPPHPLLANVPSWFDESLTAIGQATGETHVLVEALAREALQYGVNKAKENGVSDHASFLEHGDPSTIILEDADRQSADLIVLGRRGLGSLAEMALGSVSHKVMQSCDLSCLTVRYQGP